MFLYKRKATLIIIIGMTVLFSVVMVSFLNLKKNETPAQTSEPDTTEIASASEITTGSEITESSETEPKTQVEVAIPSVETIEPTTPVEAVPKVHPYESYINQNNDFAGWITIDGTSIDSPFVQGEDNAHYLNYDYTNTQNISGAIFLDYKNKGNFYDNHMSFYGHYMTDGTIFHDLHFYKDKDFFDAHGALTIHGLRETKEYEIFSVHIVSADTYYLYLDLDDDALVEYANHFLRLSMHEKNIEFPKNLKLLTLVTCTYEFDNARLIIHAYEK